MQMVAPEEFRSMGHRPAGTDNPTTALHAPGVRHARETLAQGTPGADARRGTA